MNISPAENMWFHKLCDEKDDALHYFRQFGLHRPVVQDDMNRLSKLNDTHNPGYSMKRPLHHMQDNFPILFEAMDATFGMMPSTSRIVEQVHGILRHTVDPEDSIRFTDCQTRYYSNCYEERKERKALIKNERSGFKGHEQMKGKHTSGIKHDRTMDQIDLLGRQCMERIDCSANIPQETLPLALREQMKISSIAREGSMMLDHEVAKRKKDEYDKKARNLNVNVLTEEEIMKEAMTEKLTNDDDLRARADGSKLSDEDKNLLEKFM